MDFKEAALLGIDYGTKRVGVALSPSGTTMAFPKEVYENSSALLEIIIALCRENNVSQIVLGSSFNFSGQENKVMKDIKNFAKKLIAKSKEEQMKAKIVYEPEFYTSQQATRLQGDIKKLDASAAALILQSYVDKNIDNNINKNNLKNDD